MDETWWSRLAQPAQHTWTDAAAGLRQVEQSVAPDDPDPPALACYGLLAHTYPTPPRQPTDRREAIWLRFVDGRPLSTVTCDFLSGCLTQVTDAGQRVLVLVWDNASWHVSRQVQAWLRAHNQQVKQTGKGSRVLVCRLPVKSPWLNPIEAKWRHGKRWVSEANARLTAADLAERVCRAYRCPHEPHLTMPKSVD